MLTKGEPSSSSKDVGLTDVPDNHKNLNLNDPRVVVAEVDTSVTTTPVSSRNNDGAEDSFSRPHQEISSRSTFTSQSSHPVFEYVDPNADNRPRKQRSNVNDMDFEVSDRLDEYAQKAECERAAATANGAPPPVPAKLPKAEKGFLSSLFKTSKPAADPPPVDETSRQQPPKIGAPEFQHVNVTGAAQNQQNDASSINTVKFHVEATVRPPVQNLLGK